MAALAALAGWLAASPGMLATAPPARAGGSVFVVPGGIAGAGTAVAPRGTGGALRLVAEAQDQLAATASAARGEVPQAGPERQDVFWSAIAELQQQLEDLDGALAARDAGFGSALDAAVRAVVSIDVACRRTAGTGGAAAPETARRVDLLAGTLSRLRGTYGREALRAQRGDPLTAAERAQLQRMAEAARLWQAQLSAVTAAARRQQDMVMLATLARLDAQLRQIAGAEATLASYLAALRASQDALGIWTANAAFVEPAEQPAWQEADVGASDLTTAEETGFVLTADLASGATWSYIAGGGVGDAAAAAGPDQQDAANPARELDGTGESGEAPVPIPAAANDPGGGPPAVSPGADGIVIHGGDHAAAADWPADQPTAAGAGMAFTLQLDDIPGAESLVLEEMEPLVDPNAGADETAPRFGSEQLCRAWQLAPPPAACPVQARFFDTY